MAADRPNIVFVFADDWGWGDLGCYGHPHIRTPNLDRLASQGTLFTQFYVCSGVCSPSRAAALTGRFPARHGLHGHLASHEQNARRGMPNWLDPAVPTYTRLLRDAGYVVGHFGKWHLGGGDGAPEPFAYGIDECKINAGNGPQLGFPVVVRDRPAFLRGDEATRLGAGPRTRSSQVIVDETIAFVDRHRDEPFLVNVWLNDTHATLDPDADQLERYEHLMPDGVAHKHVGAVAIYAAVVTEADRQIGRLLEHLDAAGLRENTIFIFSADNGPEDICCPNASHSGVGSSGPFRGRKRSLYEGGIRVPFILRWPAGGVAPGAVDRDTPLCAVDLLPTFCALGGATVPDAAQLDGEDMSDVFGGRCRARTTSLMWQWRFGVMGHCINKSPMLAIRRDRWMLLMNPDLSRVELFDIPADPMQLNNLAAQQPDRVEQMAGEVLAWAKTLPEGPVAGGAGSNAYPWP
ncbi:MAG: sulfatase [Planctomycetota bacterium]